MRKKINVTKTHLPDIEKYIMHLEDVWREGWVTNYGNKVVTLEKKLIKYLEIENLHLVANGTLALQLAIKSLGSHGEIITTPFSYIASTASIIWENFTPVFADIDQKTLCIDPEKIEKRITKKTKAILGVHVFGNPCDVENIQKIARKYNLKVIYDAAHAFGIKYKNKSILNYGDVSTLSFHATKVFHTIEGGAVIAKDKNTNNKISFMRHFGHKGPYEFHDLGINAKLSELHAAMGLEQLKEVKKNINKRRNLSDLYDKLLLNEVQRIKIRPGTEYNYSYYPVIFSSEEQLLNVMKFLHKQNIFPRRYFYPSINKIRFVEQKVGKLECPVSEDISRRILCLPLFPALTKAEVKNISDLIKSHI